MFTSVILHWTASVEQDEETQGSDEAPRQLLGLMKPSMLSSRACPTVSSPDDLPDFDLSSLNAVVVGRREGLESRSEQGQIEKGSNWNVVSKEIVVRREMDMPKS